MPDRINQIRNAADDLRAQIARGLTMARTTEEFAGNHNLRGDDADDSEDLDHLLAVTRETIEAALRGCEELVATLRHDTPLPADDVGDRDAAGELAAVDAPAGEAAGVDAPGEELGALDADDAAEAGAAGELAAVGDVTSTFGAVHLAEGQAEP